MAKPNTVAITAAITSRNGLGLIVTGCLLSLLQACPAASVVRYKAGSVYDGSFESLSTCTPNSESAPDKLQRLTRQQFTNIYADLFPDSFSTSVTDIEALVATFSETTAINKIDSRYSRFAGKADAPLLRSLWVIAKGVADLVSRNPTKMGDLLGNCAANPDNACYANFIRSFGFKSQRRLLENSEIQEYLTWINGFALPEKKVAAIIARMLMSPNFIYQLYSSGTPTEAGDNLIYSLSPYEIAARVYLQYADSAPDAIALAWAQSHPAPNRQDIVDLIDSLYTNRSARVHDVTGRFFEEWTLSNRVQRFETSAKDFQTLAQGEIIDTATEGTALATNMRNELRDFGTYITHEKKGSLNDLFTDRSSLAKTDDLAKIYGVAKYTGGTPPEFPNGERSGILTRAAFVSSQRAASNLIIRGVNTRKEILCDALGNPPDNFASAPPAELVGKVNSRELTRIKTEPELCMSCHAQINPLGNAMEDFDSLGRHRERETVISEAGAVVATVDLDLKVDGGLNLDREDRSVLGAVELSEAIGQSSKAHACFAKQYFRYSRARAEKAGDGDSCTITNLNLVVSSDKANIETMMKAVAVDDAFSHFVMKK